MLVPSLESNIVSDQHSSPTFVDGRDDRQPHHPTGYYFAAPQLAVC